jgi:hypothetical protein
VLSLYHAAPGRPWRTILQLALCPRGLAKRVTEYDGIFFGAGITALQRVSKSAVPLGHDKSRHGPSPASARPQPPFVLNPPNSPDLSKARLLAHRFFGGGSQDRSGPVTFLRPARSRITTPCDVKKVKTGQRMVRLVETARFGSWFKSAVCSARQAKSFSPNGLMRRARLVGRIRFMPAEPRLCRARATFGR